MSYQHHHLISNILHLLAGGGLGLVAAALAQHIGSRSADRMPGDSRAPQCFYCLRPLNWQEIVPLFGWLLRPDTLKFPCACGLRQGLWMQPAAEIMGIILGMLSFLYAGWSPMLVPLALGLGLLPAIALIDLQFGIIPDGLNLLLGILGVWWVLVSDADRSLALVTAGALLAVGLFCALVYSKWRGKEMLGLGDVKFMAAAGLWLPPLLAPWFLVLAGFTGAAIGLTMRRFGGDQQFPFAPSLSIALAFCVLYHLAVMP